MVADPTLFPLTTACDAANVAPPAMRTLGVTVTLEVSLLVRKTVTPPAGAGVVKLTGYPSD
jgi:hypothetical protein